MHSRDTTQQQGHWERLAFCYGGHQWSSGRLPGLWLGKRRQEHLSINTFVLRDQSQDRVKRSQSQRGMRRYGNALMTRLFCLQDEVAALLVDDHISPAPT